MDNNQDILDKLKLLYKENIDFIEKTEKEKNSYMFTEEFKRLKQVNDNLKDYISSIEKCSGCKCILNQQYWCNLISNTMYGLSENKILDDDNFPINE